MDFLETSSPYRFGNVGIESPTQQAESVRHVDEDDQKVLSGTAY